MLTFPALIIAMLGAAGLGTGIALGGPVGIIGGLLVAAGCAWVVLRTHDRTRNDAVARFPGGAVAGVATVLSYENVGSTIHDEPMLRTRIRVSVPGQSPYEATCFDEVSRYAASRLSTNAAFRCAVDPMSPRDVTVHWDQPVTLDGFSDPQNRLGVHTPIRTDASLSAAALLAAGMPGSARIVQSSSQGTVAANGDPIMVFVLHVVPDNGTPPFQSLTAQRVPPEHLSLTVAGTPLRVAYDPENRTRMVAIDWDAVTAASRAPAPATVEDGICGPETGATPFVVTSTPHASS